MPVQPTYPGVYIEEIPSGVHTITGVSTSIAAFIDYFKRGPMNKAVQIFNFGDFEREFGGLDASSEASYAIQQFFLNGGSQAYVIRAASGAFAPASVEIGDTASTGSNSAMTVSAIQDGSWGNNIRVTINHDTILLGGFNMAVTEYSANNTPIRQEKFLNLSTDSNSLRYAKKVVNDENSGSKIVRIELAGIELPAVNGTLSGDHSASGVSDADTTIGITAPNPTFNITIDGVTPLAPAVLTLPDTSTGGNYRLFDVALALENAIRSAKPDNPLFAGAKVLVWNGRLHVLSGDPRKPKAEVSFAKNGADTTADELLLTGSNAQVNIQEYGLGVSGQGGAVLSFVAGNDGNVPNATAMIGSLNSKTGMFALEDVDLFNILCIPRTGMTTDLNSMSESEADSVISAAQVYCEQKRAILILDTPNGISDLPGIKNWMTQKATLRTKNSALYYPRVLVPDPLNEFRLRSIGACGTVAGLYARTDSNRGVWKAPAGTEASLRNVSKLSDVLSDQENGVLNPLGINCLRNFPVYGTVSWGARTLEGADALASEWKYLPVRRLALFLEESLFRGTQWVVFEPNDEPLWAQIRLNIGAFMNNLFKQGAFQGTSPREAYIVKCDRETTTQNDINLGIVNILVGFAPLKPAEFVIIKIQQLAGQIQS